MKEQKTALIFPGQGTQEVGMGHKLYERYPLAAYLYGLADGILGYAISKISFEGPKEELDQTINTQPAIFVLNHLFYEVLKGRKKRDFDSISFTAGHSLGEYNALVAAGAFSFADGLKLVQARSRAMQMACQTNPGGLLAVIKPTEEIVLRLKELGLEIALDNAPGQTVFGGRKAVSDEAAAWLKENNIRAINPGVAGAFHTSLMEPAIGPFSKALQKIEIRDCEIPVIANTTAQPIRKAEDIRQELIQQLTHTVLWKDTITYLDQQGVHRFIEVGEKQILTNMVKRIIIGGVIGTTTIAIAGGIIAAVLSKHHPHKNN